MVFLSVAFLVNTYIDTLSKCILHLDVVSTLAKNVKSCVIKLDKEKITFLISEEGSRSLNMWCQMKQVITSLCTSFMKITVEKFL